MANQSSTKVIGIDLGTTNSVVAVLESGEPTVISNSEGFRTTPSIVAYGKNKELLVGQLAKRQSIINPENTFYSVKRFIGRKFSEIKIDTQRVSYGILADERGNVKIHCPALDKQFSPEEISAEVLKKLSEDASTFLKEEVKKAVVTVPAYFNDSERQATKDAGQIAGLEILRIINEPTAAALAYGLGKKTEDETILVFDLGGGTFDVSILEVGDGLFEVLSTAGDTNLGGDDFDKAILDHLISDFNKKEKINLTNDKQALQRVIEASEKAKIELSTLEEVAIKLPFLISDKTGPKSVETTLTREKFNELTANLIKRCSSAMLNALEASKIKPEEIEEVIMVGGSSRIPAVKDLVKKILKKEPNQSVNPDEVIALGAAIQGGVLIGEVENVLLLDVTPLSLGVETFGGLMSKIIPRNTTVPTESTETFGTAMDNQTMVVINVLQGEREFAEDNKSLGQFLLDDIPPAPRGMAEIKVTFEIDTNGILSVRAKEKRTQKQQSITIENASTLSKDEIENIMKQAQESSIRDKEKREIVELSNELDAKIYRCETELKECEIEIPEQLEKSIKETLSNAAKVKYTGTKEEILKQNEEVNKILLQLFSYRSSNNSGKNNQESSKYREQNKDQKIIDVNIEDEN